ncbi:gfo/Idh/MocA family oxidoreductase [Paenibacillus spiritus]|uniref:Gfo/Idh/MocA family oxidoreductase n=1 Tax=Paenibacillus spiritus TaxID=2496557 RepID=A0A5J5G9I5_9BACL|nr:Gfo/Idh/MocA family oxidoreductase [Paenibacillus spiritus]KAA9004688.1 gfo/Idh/MocA family oxidoreductase [Paenibacillus spiritus]
MNRTVFGIIGGGWRAEFYMRIARALPGHFAVGAALLREPAKARAFTERWGVPAVSELSAYLERAGAAGCAFSVVCVSRDASGGLLAALAEAGHPALAETPPAPDLAGLLELWSRTGPAARIQVAEQYAYQPMHAARLALAGSGRLGAVTQAQISAAHDYHGVSLIRRLLGIGFEDAEIRAREFAFPLIQGPDRSGPPRSETQVLSKQLLATLDFGDRLGVYDFAKDQYFSWVRGNRMLIRGDRGEITDERAVWLEAFDAPAYAELRRIDAGHGGNLEGFFLQGIVGGSEWLYRNPFGPARLSDDELAVAESLRRMASYTAGGPPFYSLAEGCQDQYLALAMRRAAAEDRAVITARQPWAEPPSR